MHRISKTIKGFEDTGIVTDMVRPVHRRDVRTAENIASVSENVTGNANSSIPRRSQQFGMSNDSFWPAIEDYEVDDMWFQQTMPSFHNTKFHVFSTSKSNKRCPKIEV